MMRMEPPTSIVTKDDEPPDWFDTSKVRTLWEDSNVAFECSAHKGCEQREHDGVRPSCHAEVVFGMHIVAAVAEGFCPWHQNCRLEQVDLFLMNVYPVRLGAEAHGRCTRDGRVWVIGTDDTGRQWWEWNLYDPPRKQTTRIPW